MGLQALLAAAGGGGAFHPLSLRFADAALERELRAAGVRKLALLNKLLVGLSAAAALGMLVEGSSTVWVPASLFVGQSVFMCISPFFDPSRALLMYEVGLSTTLCAAGFIHLLSDFSNVEPHSGDFPATETFDICDPLFNGGPMMPLVAMLVLGMCWMACLWWLHVGSKIKVIYFTGPLVTHGMNPMFRNVISWEEEVQMVTMAMITGTVLGYMLERTARESFLQLKERQSLDLRLVRARAEADSRELREHAHRVINHASRRVMCNTVQTCDAVVERLRNCDVGKSRDDLINMLKTHIHESIAGFHRCQSAVLRTNVARHVYEPLYDVLTLKELFSELGLFGNERIDCSMASDSDSPMHLDKLIVETILFNAVQNAFTHGRRGALIRVVGQLEDNILCVRIHNKPGPVHANLLKLRCDDLMTIQLPRSQLSKEHVDVKDSSYLGLQEIKALCDLRTECKTSLRVLPSEAVFELKLLVRRFPTLNLSSKIRQPPQLKRSHSCASKVLAASLPSPARVSDDSKTPSGVREARTLTRAQTCVSKLVSSSPSITPNGSCCDLVNVSSKDCCKLSRTRSHSWDSEPIESLRSSLPMTPTGGHHWCSTNAPMESFEPPLSQLHSSGSEMLGKRHLIDQTGGLLESFDLQDKSSPEVSLNAPQIRTSREGSFGALENRGPPSGSELVENDVGTPVVVLQDHGHSMLGIPSDEDLSGENLRGMTIIYADADMIPRLFMETVLECIDVDHSSRILGELDEELLALPQIVASLAHTHGHERVIAIIAHHFEASGMPSLTGLDLCKQLREEHHFKGLIVIISSDDECDVLEAVMSAGADAHISKRLHTSSHRLVGVLSSIHRSKFSRARMTRMKSDVEESRSLHTP